MKQTNKQQEKGSQTTKIIIITTIVFMLLLFSSCAALIISLGMSESSSGNVAVVPVQGIITTTGTSSRTVTTADDLTKILNNLKDDKKVQAVILDINSGGGSPVGSDEIGLAIQELREVKPVVGVIREVGASGAYWVAANTDYIVANRMSITGSIGVTASSFGIEELLDEYNITYRRIVSGDRKDVGSPFREMTQEELSFLQQKIDAIHDFFVEEVAHNRNMTIEEVDALATGEFFLGIEAYNHGLVDSLGGFDKAYSYLEEQGIVADPYRVRIRTGLFDELFNIELKLSPTAQQALINT